jgi:hypothetical protein
MQEFQKGQKKVNFQQKSLKTHEMHNFQLHTYITINIILELKEGILASLN